MFKKILILTLFFFVLIMYVFPMNYSEMKKEVDIFSQILNTSLKESVSHPLVISDPPRGAYVGGFGVIFHTTLNLNRVSILALSSKKKANFSKLGDKNFFNRLRKNVVEVISQYGNGFKLLPSDEKVCIIVHVLKRNFVEGKNLDKVLIISVKKKYIIDLLTKSINFQNFIKRVKYIEY